MIPHGGILVVDPDESTRNSIGRLPGACGAELYLYKRTIDAHANPAGAGDVVSDPRILVVDDSATVRRILINTLHTIGHGTPWRHRAAARRFKRSRIIRSSA